VYRHQSLRRQLYLERKQLSVMRYEKPKTEYWQHYQDREDLCDASRTVEVIPSILAPLTGRSLSQNCHPEALHIKFS